MAKLKIKRKTKKIWRTIWRTKDELRNLARLPEEKVRKYLKLMPLRDDWGKLKKEVVLDYCMARVNKVKM